jgi:hypothetical protein
VALLLCAPTRFPQQIGGFLDPANDRQLGLGIDLAVCQVPTLREAAHDDLHPTEVIAESGDGALDSVLVSVHAGLSKVAGRWLHLPEDARIGRTPSRPSSSYAIADKKWNKIFRGNRLRRFYEFGSHHRCVTA